MMIMMMMRKRRMAMKIIQIIGGLPLGKERGMLLGKSVSLWMQPYLGHKVLVN